MKRRTTQRKLELVDRDREKEVGILFELQKQPQCERLRVSLFLSCRNHCYLSL